MSFITGLIRFSGELIFDYKLVFNRGDFRFQIDGAKTFFSPQNMKNSSECCLLVQYSKKSMVQLHPLHHPNAAPEYIARLDQV